MATTLDEAVRNAVEAPVEERPAPTEPQPQEPQKVPKKEDEEQEEEPQERLDPRILPALQLYESLRDPTTARAAISALMQQNGIGIPEAGTVTSQRKNIIERMKEKVPAEHQFLIDSLAPAINELIQEHMQEQVAPVKIQQEQLALQAAKNQYDGVFNSIEKKFGDVRKFESAMNELANKFPMSPNVDLEEYVEGLYKMASSDKKSEDAVNKVVNRVNKNARERVIPPANVDETSIRKGSKLPTLNEAVKAAMRGEKLI